MSNHSWSVGRTAGAILVLGSLACFVGAGMYVQEEGTLVRDELLHTWVRILISAAVVLTAIGFGLLEDAFQGIGGRALGRIGAGVYLFGGVLVVAGEALAFTLGWEHVVPLIIVYDVMAYLAQACVGAALVQARIVNPIIGWATIVWNLGWLLALVIVGWAVGYIPLLHHLMPFVIGIALLRRRG
jgi:hypothetical protein